MSCLNFNPRSSCNSSSRCCYRAREHVDPAWSRRIRHGGDSHLETSSFPGSVGLARAHYLFDTNCTARWSTLLCCVCGRAKKGLRMLTNQWLIVSDWFSWGYMRRGSVSYSSAFNRTVVPNARYVVVSGIYLPPQQPGMPRVAGTTSKYQNTTPYYF